MRKLSQYQVIFFDSRFKAHETEPEATLMKDWTIVVFSRIRALLWASTIALLMASPLHAGEIMFDGYYRVELEGKHVGFVVQRYEFDSSKKNFTSTIFTKMKIGTLLRQESLKAVSSDKFQPLSFQYTFSEGDSIKTVDAIYKNQADKVTASLTINDGKNTKALTSVSPKGTFLSSFLAYLMLQSGIDVGKKFAYSAVAEEDGNSYRGEAWVKEPAKFAGQDAMRVVNKFKGESFVSYVNKKGDVLGTESPKQNLNTILVASPALATEDQTVPNKILRQLFGDIPLGKVNPIARAGSEKEPEKVPEKTLEKTQEKGAIEK